MYKEIRYFKGLDALRFFAAYLVVIHHAEQIRYKNAMFNLKEYSLFNNGGIAVTFFFVLSGFLISYLLLKELDQSKSISINKFYIRRILRIWPLYFLLVAIGTLIVPFFLNIIGYSYEMPYQFSEVILYYLFFTPFMVNVIFGNHLLEPLWSIGVEEIFYIFFAPLHNFFKKYIWKVLVAIIFLKILLLLLLPKLNLSHVVIQVINMLKFEAMAIGALASYMVYHRKENLESSFIFSKLFQVILFLFIFIRIIGFKYFSSEFVIFNYLFTTPIISSILLMISFALIIVNVSTNKNSIVNLENRFLKFLGEISYGIYMYHMLVIFGIILILKKYLSVLPGTFASIVFYLILTIMVISISFISKRIFEDYFLKMKKRFINKPV